MNKNKNIDKDAFNCLYTGYREILFKKLSAILESQEEVKDIVQEVFMKIWLKRTQIKMDQSLEAYMFRMGYHMIIDHFRRQGKRRGMSSRGPHPGLAAINLLEEDSVTREDKISHLEVIINQLPPQRQRVFLLCNFGHKSYKEVSEMLAISPSTISDHIVKARSYIKTEYKKVHSA